MIFLIKRLIRRTLWLLIYQWKSLSLKQWPYESCCRCGKCFRICWSVEDKFWHYIMGVSDSGGGSLCIDCFLERAEDLEVTLPEDAIKIEIFQPEDEEIKERITKCKKM